MLYIAYIFELVVDGFDNYSFLEQYLVVSYPEKVDS